MLSKTDFSNDIANGYYSFASKTLNNKSISEKLSLFDIGDSLNFSVKQFCITFGCICI